MTAELNKIDAQDKSISLILDKSKYTIDIFQREYKWERRHIEQLISDLTSKFLSNYVDTHERKDVENYGPYFLGSIVLSQKGPVRFIIDGQQRLTSLTLLLIYLNNLQSGRKDVVALNDLIFSEKFGSKSYNIQIDERKDCMDALYNGKVFDVRNAKDESVLNVVARYNDIQELFSNELRGKALPYFIDWLINKVILVEIVTYSDDDAYTIFETMNDRGLNLTPTEMLKGYLLSNVSGDSQKSELNTLWRKKIQELNEIYPRLDEEFLKAWLRAKYAESARQRKKGSENEDFEKIGTRFHSWVRENKTKIGLKSSKDYYDFVKNDFQFFADLYRVTLGAQAQPVDGLEHVYYVGKRGFTLLYPLVMAPIMTSENDEPMFKKIALVSRYIETYIVYRTINYKTLGYDSIRYSMFSLMKEIRNKSVKDLAQILKDKVINSSEKLNTLPSFLLSDYYKWFMHFLLARITHHIEQESGVASSFESYVETGSYAPFEIEHILPDDYPAYKNGFGYVDEAEFQTYRSKIGNLLLLQNGFNQSYGKMEYSKKLPHYFGQNLLAKSLCPDCYKNNPNFLKYVSSSKLPFQASAQWGKKQIDERTQLYQKICEQIWDIDGFDTIANS
jgi:uncharacterized protein with ParB-like and HNH nuclease domain